MQWFDHSVNSATDPKIMRLRLECGGAAVDAYWYLVEQMHEGERPVCIGDAGAMRVHCHSLCTDENELQKWVSEMVSIGLLETRDEGGSVISKRAEKNIAGYEEKRDKARSAAEARWADANANPRKKRTQSKRNADGMPKQDNTVQVRSAIKSTPKPSASDGADAVETAPTAAKKPVCPRCSTVVTPNARGAFSCPEHGDVSPLYAEWGGPDDR